MSVTVAVVAKNESERLLNKNDWLLPWTLRYVKDVGIHLDHEVFLLSDSQKFLGMGEEYSCTPVFESTVYPNVLPSIKENLLPMMKDDDTHLVILQPTTPFREKTLWGRFMRVLEKHPDKQIVTTNRRSLEEDFLQYGEVKSPKMTPLTGAIIALTKVSIQRHSNARDLLRSTLTVPVDHFYPFPQFDYPEHMFYKDLLTEENYLKVFNQSF